MEFGIDSTKLPTKGNLLRLIASRIDGAINRVGEDNMARSAPPKFPSPITSPKIKHIAGVGLKTPSKLSNKQVQELAASVEAHIEPRKHKPK